MMDRNMDAGGLNYWLNQLAGHKSRKDVFGDFVYSKEFTNICNSYGIVRGSR